MKTIRQKYKRYKTIRNKNKKCNTKKCRQSLREKKRKTKKLYHYRRNNRILYQSGGEGDDAPASQEDVNFVKEIIQQNIDSQTLPDSISPEDIVKVVADSDPVDVYEDPLVFRPSVPRPKKTSLFGKLIEILFARKDLGLHGPSFEQFLALPNDAPYDVPVDFTLHLGPGNIYHNCNLSLKSKELKDKSANYSTGQIETGDAVIFLECLMTALQQASPGFKMVVEDYYCTYQPETEKMIGLMGKFRRVYDLTSQLPTIFGEYYPSGIDELYTKIKELKERCPQIMAMPNPGKRKYELDRLKTDVDMLNTEMVRKRCLIHLARKQSSDCETFEGKGKKPALRIQSALKLETLHKSVSIRGNTEEILILKGMGLPLSPYGIETPKQGVASYASFKGFAKELPPARSSGASAHDVARFAPVSHLELPPVENPQKPNPRSRSRSRSATPKSKPPKSSGRAKTPKSSGRGAVESSRSRQISDFSNPYARKFTPSRSTTRGTPSWVRSSGNHKDA